MKNLTCIPVWSKIQIFHMSSHMSNKLQNCSSRLWWKVTYFFEITVNKPHRNPNIKNTNTLMLRTLFRIAMCTLHVDNTWYTRDSTYSLLPFMLFFHHATNACRRINKWLPSVYSQLPVGVCFEFFASQVLLKNCEWIEIIARESGIKAAPYQCRW